MTIYNLAHIIQVYIALSEVKYVYFPIALYKIPIVPCSAIMCWLFCLLSVVVTICPFGEHSNGEITYFDNSQKWQ